MNNHDHTASAMPAELLLDYATGASPEPVALAVATVLDLNPTMAVAYHRLNCIGGSLLDSIEPVTCTDESLRIILSRLSQQVSDQPPEKLHTVAQTSRVPFPLQAYIGNDFEALSWNSLTSGVEEYVLTTDQRGYRTSLLRIAPGKAMPHHGHAGAELTVVIEGAYDAEGGHFCPGDMEVAGPDVQHKPVADAVTGCLCLAVLSAPVQLTGFVGWFINPFLRV